MSDKDLQSGTHITAQEKAPWDQPRLTLVGDVAQVLNIAGGGGKVADSLADPGEQSKKTKPSG
jgi:hypothetical protein